MDTGSFIVNIKTEEVYGDIANDAEKKLTHRTIKLKDPYKQIKIKKVIKLMTDDLGGKNMTKPAEYETKTYFYLIDDGGVNKNVNGKKVFDKTET